MLTRRKFMAAAIAAALDQTLHVADIRVRWNVEECLGASRKPMAFPKGIVRWPESDTSH